VPDLSSFSLGSACTSRRPPDSEPRIPFVCFRDVRGNDGKVFPLGSADHVDLSAGLARARHKTAMAARGLAMVSPQQARGLEFRVRLEVKGAMAYRDTVTTKPAPGPHARRAGRR
jgi:hypothetical protein